MEWTTSLSRFAEHLPKDGNAELSLLKVHLLIEELLNLVIVRNMKRPRIPRESSTRLHEEVAPGSGVLGRRP